MPRQSPRALGWGSSGTFMLGPEAEGEFDADEMALIVVVGYDAGP
jgi:hypothetical protein